jgi:hypothetical protein
LELVARGTRHGTEGDRDGGHEGCFKMLILNECNLPLDERQVENNTPT